MDSERLRARRIQPGNVQRFRPSEKALFDVIEATFQPPEFSVSAKPKTLARFYRLEGESHRFGLKPDGEIVHAPSGRPLFLEIKNQGKAGNAEERAYRHHTRVFEERLRSYFPKLGVLDYHPYVTIFTGALATNPRYTLKFRHHIDARQYFLWTNYETRQGKLMLAEFLKRFVDKNLVR